MADPFSIIASTISIVDVCARLVVFFAQVKRGSDTVDKELDTLVEEIGSLNAGSIAVRNCFERELAGKYDKNSKDEAFTADLWRATGNTLQDCQRTLNDLDSLIKKLIGDDGLSTFDKVRRYFRKQAEEDELHRLSQRLNRGHQLLEILLTAINIIYPEDTGDVGPVIRRTILNNSAGRILATVDSIRPLASLNVHFMIPQSVSSTFTGLKAALESLKHAYLAPAPPGQSPEQKRFVIYGLGGTGKTQFCCKFAQDNRHDFWGVFYIDASSSGSAKSSYADIAEKAAAENTKIEANERSVKYWLSSQKRPWLLILDNVDDRSGSAPPESYFPECEAGLLLITTKNQSLKTLGNLGPRFYEFKGLAREEGIYLLLTSAGHLTPWKSTWIQAATDICEALGYLPLAIVQAGKAILKELCTLHTYLSFFERTWSRVRESIQERHGGRARRGSSDSNETVYSGFEIVFQAASEDAIELLKLFSFMHPQQLRLEILVRAVLNSRLEKEAEKEAASQQGTQLGLPRKRLGQLMQSFLLRLYQLTVASEGLTVLPKILQDVWELERDEIEFRLRAAFAQLRSVALVDYVAADDRYSMHTLVHRWARERMSLAEQAVWCQSACSILAHTVLIPPLGVEESEVEFRRRVLPHIEHVMEQEANIQERFRRKRRERRKPWPVPQRILRRSDIRQYAKFSLVCAENGLWDKTMGLMLVVDRFLSQHVGLGQPAAIRARLLLSESYWWLGKEDEAASLQLELLEACKATRGEEDSHTLNVMDRLGVSLWMQSKFQKARDYQKRAVEGFQTVHAGDHADTFRAMTHLGRVVGKLAEFDEAVRLHTEALEGLRRDSLRPPHDRDVLEVIENLAMARYDRHRYGHRQANELEIAEQLQSTVVLQRESRLGARHPLTLWAYCNLARIKADLGAVGEAEEILRSRLPVAEYMLGATHIGILFGKAYFGHILTLRDKCSEAEGVLKQVIQEHENTRRDHPDQLVAVAFLIECYRHQGKHTEVVPLQEKILKGVKHHFGEKSPWEEYFVKNYFCEELLRS
ncbi:MAG: hypothetical protein M1821_000769 [Bathelium mastoideum]|nr:MAG: hypothetical protein M1821_000769 [Bathelium mastoideum]